MARAGEDLGTHDDTNLQSDLGLEKRLEFTVLQAPRYLVMHDMNGSLAMHTAMVSQPSRAKRPFRSWKAIPLIAEKWMTFFKISIKTMTYDFTA